MRLHNDMLSCAVGTDLGKTFCGHLYMQVLLTMHLLVVEEMSSVLMLSVF